MWVFSSQEKTSASQLPDKQTPSRRYLQTPAIHSLFSWFCFFPLCFCGPVVLCFSLKIYDIFFAPLILEKIRFAAAGPVFYRMCTWHLETAALAMCMCVHVRVCVQSPQSGKRRRLSSLPFLGRLHRLSLLCNRHTGWDLPTASQLQPHNRNTTVHLSSAP